MIIAISDTYANGDKSQNNFGALVTFSWKFLSKARHDMARHATARHDTAQHGTAQHSIAQHDSPVTSQRSYNFVLPAMHRQRISRVVRLSELIQSSDIADVTPLPRPSIFLEAEFAIGVGRLSLYLSFSIFFSSTIATITTTTILIRLCIWLKNSPCRIRDSIIFYSLYLIFFGFIVRDSFLCYFFVIRFSFSVLS